MKYERLALLLRVCGIAVYEPHKHANDNTKRRILHPRYGLVPVVYIVFLALAIGIIVSYIVSSLRAGGLFEDLFALKL